jgi:hypothetical protein
MATYMFQYSYSLDSVKGMVAKPQNRREAAEKVIAAADGLLRWRSVPVGHFPTSKRPC